MGKSKYLVVLPLAVTMLAACGSKDTNFVSTDFENALKITESYAASVKNNKVSNIEVGGHINKINVKGDMTWWSLKGESVKGFPYSLLSMIPNFTLTDSEINVDSQEIAKFTMPGSLMSAAEDATGIGQGSTEAFQTLLIDNLPKFPMNSRFLTVINGVESLFVPGALEIDWDNLKPKAWDKAQVTYFTGDGRLKINLHADDPLAFFDEVMVRLNPQYTPQPHPDIPVFPADISLTTSKIGYIDSLSVKAKFEKVDKTLPTSEEAQTMFFTKLKGDLEADFSLKFKQSFSDPITIKYQLSVYCKPDAEHPAVTTYGGEPIALKEIKPLTTNLEDFKDYVTFDWIKNVKKSKGSGQPSEIIENYDDPVFDLNYWCDKDAPKNVAFSDDNYDIVMLPTYNSTTLKPKYIILGADFSNNISSLHTISSNGCVVNNPKGFSFNGFKKIFESASDTLTEVLISAKGSETLTMDEIFINSNMLKADGTEYIVNLAVGEVQ